MDNQNEITHKKINQTYEHILCFITVIICPMLLLNKVGVDPKLAFFGSIATFFVTITGILLLFTVIKPKTLQFDLNDFLSVNVMIFLLSLLITYFIFRVAVHSWLAIGFSIVGNVIGLCIFVFCVQVIFPILKKVYQLIKFFVV